MKIQSERDSYFSKDFGVFLKGGKVVNLVIMSSLGIKTAWGCGL